MAEEPLIPLGYEPPETGSAAYAAFEKAYWDIFEFLTFLEHVSGVADELRTRMKKIHTILQQVPAEGGGASSTEAAAVTIFGEALEEQSRFVRETLTVRAVDNYLTYLKDILYQVCRARPEVLRSGETVRLDFVLKFGETADLVDALAEKKVQDLSYGSLYDLAAFFQEKLGLRLAEDAGGSSHLALLVEMRNLIVHNRGIVNAVFLKKTAAAREKIGDKLKATWTVGEPIAFGIGEKGLSFLAKSVHLIDTEASVKFDLPQVPAYIVGRKSRWIKG